MNPETVRGQELMCEYCGCTHWVCLTKFDGECCDDHEHPPPNHVARPAHPDTMIGRGNA